MSKCLSNILISIVIVLNSTICFCLGEINAINEINKEPKAIDVYRGKTTLKISYMDSIPQDTLVLWKNTTPLK
jgi:hypothetical protein